MRAAKILLIDDDRAVRESLKFALCIDGFDVEIFGCMETFLASARAEEPDCFILDHRLPGLDALVLLARLRSAGATAPAIILTSNPTGDVRTRIAALGAMTVEKPLLDDELFSLTRTLAHERRDGR